MISYVTITREKQIKMNLFQVFQKETLRREEAIEPEQVPCGPKHQIQLSDLQGSGKILSYRASASCLFLTLSILTQKQPKPKLYSLR